MITGTTGASAHVGLGQHASQSALLVVDDERFDQLRIERLMQRTDVVGSYHIASSGTTALDLMQMFSCLGAAQGTWKVTALIDLRMPQMGGLEFLERAIAEFGSETFEAVYFMSGVPVPQQLAEQALSYSPVKNVFSKPISEDCLRWMVGGGRSNGNHPEN